jgi:hypothetical protein
MRVTVVIGLGATLGAICGCAYGFRGAMTAGYSAAHRPESSYYCYDCHGYRYFDPYYDWCTSHGFRYDWGRHPRAVSVYRKRYLGLRKANRDFGRYSYPEDYRARPHYRTPRDYESWRLEQGRSGDSGRSLKPGSKVREQKRPEPGTRKKRE